MPNILEELMRLLQGGQQGAGAMSPQGNPMSWPPTAAGGSVNMAQVDPRLQALQQEAERSTAGVSPPRTLFRGGEAPSRMVPSPEMLEQPQQGQPRIMPPNVPAGEFSPGLNPSGSYNNPKGAAFGIYSKMRKRDPNADEKEMDGYDQEDQDIAELKKYNDERLLDHVRRGMGDSGWEGEDDPTDKDIQRLHANPDDIDDFVGQFGEESVPENFWENNEDLANEYGMSGSGRQNRPR